MKKQELKNKIFNCRDAISEFTFRLGSNELKHGYGRIKIWNSNIFDKHLTDKDISKLTIDEVRYITLTLIKCGYKDEDIIINHTETNRDYDGSYNMTTIIKFKLLGDEFN